MQPLVSVVVPCYNQAPFVGAAVESVLAQRYPALEVIVVDDGSTDGTADVVARYREVRQIRQTRRGLSCARNAGWRASRGEFLVFLDADDLLLPGALNAGVECLLANPHCAFTFGDYYYANADGSLRNKLPQRTVERDHYLALLRENYIGMHATVMYRRHVLEELGGFNPRLAACEDYDLYLRIARRYPVCSHCGVVAAYRQHGANMSDDPALMLKAVLRVLRAQRQHARADDAGWRAYRAGFELWRGLYGEALVDRFGATRRNGQHREAARCLLALARYAPAYAARRALSRFAAVRWRAALAGVVRRRWRRVDGKRRGGSEASR